MFMIRTLSVQQHMPKPRFGVKVAKIFGAGQSAHVLLLAGQIVLFTQNHLVKVMQVDTDSRMTISLFIYDNTVHLLRWFLHFCYHSLLLHFHQFGVYCLQELLQAFLEGV